MSPEDLVRATPAELQARLNALYAEIRPLNERVASLVDEKDSIIWELARRRRNADTA